MTFKIVSFFLMGLGLMFNVIAVIGVGFYKDLMKKAHCFSLASNAGMVFFFIGAGLYSDRIFFGFFCCFLLFLTSPLLSSILGTFCSQGANIKAVDLQHNDQLREKL
ncbi:MAG: monovalent cation/H(+) antiporter subunit G [Deltaproteobacteria bacterium]|nr:monovalent cation/H(+) antiporter subunit G [Deltaproteobacteria bacterium]MCX7952096.1 monovalent cation/H(+) antiporter subunit G [Deltaproteobacteria bacterium]